MTALSLVSSVLEGHLVVGEPQFLTAGGSDPDVLGQGDDEGSRRMA